MMPCPSSQFIWAAPLSKPVPPNLTWSKWDVVLLSRLEGGSGLTSKNHWTTQKAPNKLVKVKDIEPTV